MFIHVKFIWCNDLLWSCSMGLSIVLKNNDVSDWFSVSFGTINNLYLALSNKQHLLVETKLAFKKVMDFRMFSEMLVR